MHDIQVITSKSSRNILKLPLLGLPFCTSSLDIFNIEPGFLYTISTCLSDVNFINNFPCLPTIHNKITFISTGFFSSYCNSLAEDMILDFYHIKIIILGLMLSFNRFIVGIRKPIYEGRIIYE